MKIQGPGLCPSLGYPALELSLLHGRNSTNLCLMTDSSDARALVNSLEPL